MCKQNARDGTIPEAVVWVCFVKELFRKVSKLQKKAPAMESHFSQDAGLDNQLY